MPLASVSPSVPHEMDLYLKLSPHSVHTGCCPTYLPGAGSSLSPGQRTPAGPLQEGSSEALSLPGPTSSFLPNWQFEKYFLRALSFHSVLLFQKCPDGVLSPDAQSPLRAHSPNQVGWHP